MNNRSLVISFVYKTSTLSTTRRCSNLVPDHEKIEYKFWIGLQIVKNVFYLMIVKEGF